ncbi:hypothetical protein AB6735_00055 [Mucilaginibacter sp. RCC_168]|uniref:hypothetical protein n=1 Tax=Mucilaginibacter sp. RCC_168 TaxID=3239221 RepID=UPI003523A51E
MAELNLQDTHLVQSSINSNIKYEKKIVKNDPLKLLKNGIWVYFFLLIFEGALRKWVLPFWSAPLLIIRDPIAIFLIYTAWKKGIRFNNHMVGMVVFIGILATIFALSIGHGNLIVAVYGARIFVVYFPFMFVIGSVFNREDVLKIGKATLWISIPMVILIALQFYSPQSSLVNRGIGNDSGGSGFSGALGFFRPSGTFSFTNGIGLFFGLVAAYVLYFWINPNSINRVLLIAATVALITAMPLSISRTLIAEIAISIAFVGLYTINKPSFAGKIVMIGFAIIILFALLSQLSFIQTAIQALSVRFENASAGEGGVIEGTIGDRFFGGMIRAITSGVEGPPFGQGIGKGTNVGAQLLVGDREVFLIAEEEWGRLMGEMGAVMGLTIIFIRLRLCVKLLRKSFAFLKKGDLLPWMLLSFGLVILANGQWGQPTALGFAMLIGGLVMASFNSE